MDVAEFDFALPPELIAQEPPAVRGTSRLLVLDRSSGAIADSRFDQLDRVLRAGDLLVVNNTRVFPARLLGNRVPSGGAVECLLVRPCDEDIAPDAGGMCAGASRATAMTWEALVHPGQKLKPGAQVAFEGGGARLRGEILARHFHGRRSVRLWTEDGVSVTEAIERLGHMPLPPYIHRPDRAADRERYQTVYARAGGSIAAPTAGLHFTDDLLRRLDDRGVQRIEITLHVGYGTFKPVRVERVEEHVVDAETFSVSEEAAGAISLARRERRRVIAVGTTTTRALESLETNASGDVRPAHGATGLFLHPGSEFRIVQGLITNFHLPRSSLLMLVAAFAGRDAVLGAYHHAVRERYRFYSYGDAMAIL